MHAAGIESSAASQHDAGERLGLGEPAQALQVAHDVAEDVQDLGMSWVELLQANRERLVIESIGGIELLLLAEQSRKIVVVGRELECVRAETSLVDLDRSP